MSESTGDPNGKTDVNPTDGKKEEVKDANAVLSKNQELLGKLRAQSDKAKALEDEVNELKTSKMSAEGKKDELIEALKGQLGDAKKRESELGWNIVSGQVAVEASKRGCRDVDALMKIVDFGSVAIDTGSFTVAKEDVNLILDKAQKERVYLFESPTKKPKDAGASHSIDDGPQDFSKMGRDKLLDAYRAVAMKTK